jgi:hypothetical protein
VTRPDESSAAQLIFSGQLAAFRRKIEGENMPGNLDGLFARHVLGDGAQLRWRVDPEMGAWLEENADRLEDAPALAVLGYLAAARPKLLTIFSDALVAGLERLMQRDPYPIDRVTPLYSASHLTGLRLAGQAVQDRLPGFLPWLRGTFDHASRKPNDQWLELVHKHVLAELTGEPTELLDLASMSGDALAAAFYLISCGTGTVKHAADDLRGVQRRAMHEFLRTDPAETDVRKAVLWLHFAETAAMASADELVVRVEQVSRVLSHFPSALRRWRWDADDLQDPIRWRIDAEREVQDILWIMLRAAFTDVIDEATLPKLAHSSFRADFAFPRQGLLIEVKYARTHKDFKEIEHQVMVDSVAYLKETDQYREIIVFIYDDSRSVEHHDLTQRMLSEMPGIADVIIVSRPGMLPEADQRKNEAALGGARSPKARASGRSRRPP